MQPTATCVWCNMYLHAEITNSRNAIPMTDKIRNEGIGKELEMFSMNIRIRWYRKHCLELMESMEERQVPKQGLCLTECLLAKRSFHSLIITFLMHTQMQFHLSSRT
jgi:hypothetical protein